VLLALVSKLLIIKLQYLAGLLLPVEDVLQISFRSLQLIYSRLKLCNNKAQWVRLPLDLQQVPNKTSRVPLFLLRRDLFFRTKSSLFACISWMLLRYLAKAVSSFDYMATVCFQAFASSSNASARSTVSTKP
jgi:hypothetical protein